MELILSKDGTERVVSSEIILTDPASSYMPSQLEPQEFKLLATLTGEWNTVSLTVPKIRG